jgi:hypothetical protein
MLLENELTMQNQRIKETNTHTKQEISESQRQEIKKTSNWIHINTTCHKPIPMTTSSDVIAGSGYK